MTKFCNGFLTTIVNRTSLYLICEGLAIQIIAPSFVNHFPCLVENRTLRNTTKQSTYLIASTFSSHDSIHLLATLILPVLQTCNNKSK